MGDLDPESYQLEHQICRPIRRESILPECTTYCSLTKEIENAYATAELEPSALRWSIRGLGHAAGVELGGEEAAGLVTVAPASQLRADAGWRRRVTLVFGLEKEREEEVVRERVPNRAVFTWRWQGM